MVSPWFENLQQSAARHDLIAYHAYTFPVYSLSTKSQLIPTLNPA